MRPTPFFIPTSQGDISAIATLPTEEVRGRPIVVIPGGNNPRSRDPMARRATLRLVEAGRPVLRMDHAGAGTSAAAWDVDGYKRLDAVKEVCERFIELCESGELTLVGTCGGALSALHIAVELDSVTEVVAIACPFRHRPETKRRVRAGIAAIDPIGKPLVRSLSRGYKPRGSITEYLNALIAELPDLTKRTNLSFLYGDNDIFLDDFEWLRSSGTVPEPTVSQWHLDVVPGANLYGYSSVEVMEKLEDALVRALSLERAESN